MFRFKELHRAAKMPVSEKRNGKALPDKKGLKSMKDFLHDFFNPPKFVKPTETKKVFARIQDQSQYLYCRQGGGEEEEEKARPNPNATPIDGDKRLHEVGFLTHPSMSLN